MADDQQIPTLEGSQHQQQQQQQQEQQELLAANELFSNFNDVLISVISATPFSSDNLNLYLDQFTLYYMHYQKKNKIEFLQQLKNSGLVIINSGDNAISDCRICLDEFKVGDEVCVLECSHKLHASCLLDWFKRNISCPICRSKISMEYVIQLIFCMKTL